LANCQLVLPTDIQAANGVLQFLLGDDPPLVCVPFDEQFVLATCEEFIFVGRDTKPPELFVVVAIHQYVCV
jgi:hypothetical protein